MGLSYTGKSCLLVTMVRGYRRVPAPPARMMPFMGVLLPYSSFSAIIADFAGNVTAGGTPPRPARRNADALIFQTPRHIGAIDAFALQ